jgi:hypothetical protein
MYLSYVKSSPFVRDIISPSASKLPVNSNIPKLKLSILELFPLKNTLSPFSTYIVSPEVTSVQFSPKSLEYCKFRLVTSVENLIPLFPELTGISAK